MIVLIPISKFRVVYEVAEGQPYSHLERLVLKAVSSGICSMLELTSTFEIHPRLLIESLVTLTHAGWIALGRSPNEQFVATPEGRRAINEGQVPDSLVISRRTAFVLLERVAGTIMPDGEVRYVPRKLLEKEGLWDSCLRLKAEMVENVLNEGQVQQLLPRDQGQRLHWVGPIEMVTKGVHYIPASVEPSSGIVYNLPARCGSYLSEVVLERSRAEAARRDAELEADVDWEGLFGKKPLVAVSIDDAWHAPISWGEDVWLLRDDAAHIEFFLNAINRARRSILALSGVISLAALEEMRPSLIDALSRGVDVDLLWGRQSERGILDWMKRLAYEGKNKELSGRVRFNRESAECKGNVVIWDDEDDSFCAGISSGGWLGPNGPRMGVGIKHPGIVSDLCWYVSGLWASVRSETLSSVPDKWRRVASSLESNRGSESSEAGNEPVSLLLLRDAEHWNIADGLGTNLSALRVIAGGTRQDTGSGVSSYLLLGRTAAGPRLLEGMMGGAAMTDLAFCITSVDLLVEPVLGEERNIGLIIRGQKPTRDFEEALEAATLQRI